MPVQPRSAFSARSLVAALALTAPLVAASTARADFMDSINPMNWFNNNEKYETKIIQDPAPGVLYKRGIEALGQHDFDKSVKSFNRLEKAYPYSQYQRKGLIMAAYSQYVAKKFDDSIGTAKRYIGLYPNSPDTPYVMYLEGMAYYDQISDVNHDLSNAEKSIEVFNDLLQKYPGSEYAGDAKYKISVARDQLAGKEMTVGRYYLEAHQYTAAINRFRTVLAKYQTTRHSEEALERLTEAYLAMGLPQEAQTAAAVLGHNYPESPWYKEAYARLKNSSGGPLAPNEDKGSWISRTFRGVTSASL